LYNPCSSPTHNYLINPDLSKTDINSKINTVMIQVLVIHTAGVMGGFVRSSIMQVAGERVVARLRNRLRGCILSQEISLFDTHKTGRVGGTWDPIRVDSAAARIRLAGSDTGSFKLAVGLMF
jgi:ABC-type multidrug transport system fused ATPase/permease subunit